MSQVETEIREQPEALGRLLRDGRARVEEIAARIRERAPRYVVIAARGSSDNAARYAQYLFGAHNRLPVCLATPSLFTAYAAGPSLADALVIPGAFLMGMGRIGNFIDGLIVGSVTDVWWAVKFPDADGFRHPVVLYDGAKNLLLMLFLVRARRTNRTPGAVAARFVFWYAFPRIFIDLFRDYPTHRLALGTGQTLNILMAALGVVLLVRSRMRRLGRLGAGTPAAASSHAPLDRPPLLSQRVALVALLLFCLTIPSNWTQDIPARYGARHPSLRHSRLYPPLDTAPPGVPGRSRVLSMALHERFRTE